jgi:hypothetical protein
MNATGLGAWAPAQDNPLLAKLIIDHHSAHYAGALARLKANQPDKPGPERRWTDLGTATT